MKFVFESRFTESVLNSERKAESDGDELVFSLNPNINERDNFKQFTTHYMFDLSRVVGRIPELMDKVQVCIDKQESVLGEIESLKTDVRNLRVENVERDDRISKLEDDLEVSNAAVSEHTASITLLQNSVKDLSEELSVMKTKLEKAELNILDSERRSRQWNIRILNVPEKRGEKTPETIKLVDEMLSNILGKEMNCEYAHRTGQTKTGANSRAIIFKCNTRREKFEILKKRQEFHRRGYLIFEDLPKKDLEKMKLANLMKEKHENNHKVTFRAGKWIVDGKVYTPTNAAD